MATRSTITLTFPHVGKTHSEMYRVDSITNSTEYNPGQLLDKKTVDDILKYSHSHYTVVIKRNTEKQ